MCFMPNVIAVGQNVSGVEHTLLSPNIFSYAFSTIIRVCFKAEI